MSKEEFDAFKRDLDQREKEYLENGTGKAAESAPAERAPKALPERTPAAERTFGKHSKDVRVANATRVLSEKYFNVEQALQGENVFAMEHRLEEEGWEKRGQMDLGLEANPEDALREELGNKNYRIIIFAGIAFIFAPQGRRPKAEVAR